MAVVAQILRLIASLSLGTRASYYLSGARHLLRAIGTLRHNVLRLAFGARLLRGLNRGKIRRQILINFISHRPPRRRSRCFAVSVTSVSLPILKISWAKTLAFGRNTAPQTEKFAYRRLKGPCVPLSRKSTLIHNRS